MLKIRDGLITSLKAKYEARSRAPDADEVDGDVVAASLKSAMLRQLWMQVTWVYFSGAWRYRSFGCCCLRCKATGRATGGQ